MGAKRRISEPYPTAYPVHGHQTEEKIREARSREIEKTGTEKSREKNTRAQPTPTIQKSAQSSGKQKARRQKISGSQDASQIFGESKRQSSHCQIYRRQSRKTGQIYRQRHLGPSRCS